MILLSCCGLAFDLGSFEITRLQMQNAADAAAIGAVLAVENGRTISAGLQESAQNGFTNGVNGVTVQLTSPPASGAYLNSSFATQAVITKQVSGVFLRTSLTLRAQATAFSVATPCVYFMSNLHSQTTLLAVNESMLPTCPVYVGYDYNFNGGSSSSGGQFFVASASGNSSGSISPTAAFGAPTLSDPLAYLSAPAVGGCTYTNYSVNAAATLQPGVYCGGLTINTTAQVTLNPGLYIVLGTLSINGPTLTGTGVTLYISQAYGYVAGTTSIQNINSTLSAPTTGALQGILYFSDRNLPAGQVNLSMQNWNNSSKTDGIFYTSGQELDLSNLNLQPNNYLGFVADHVSVHNTGFHPAADYTPLNGGNPFRPNGGGAGLVE